MLSVVIPVKDIHDATKLCIEHLTAHARGDLDIILVDNASEVNASEVFSNLTVVRNSENKGFWPSMLQGIELAQSDYVLMMHNDVFIYETDFDQRIIQEFILNEKLGAVGFFGSRGVDIYGARLFPEGNMLGRRFGTPQTQHGTLLTEDHPAVVFDSLAICINKKVLPLIDPETIPPHHWTDRLICLRIVRSGFHCLTVGIGFDHGGSFTASSGAINTFSEDWCKSMNLSLDNTWEETLYKYGLKMFQEEFFEMTNGYPRLWVDKDFNYYVRQ